jgi:hypothetical protein
VKGDISNAWHTLGGMQDGRIIHLSDGFEELPGCGSVVRDFALGVSYLRVWDFPMLTA